MKVWVIRVTSNQDILAKLLVEEFEPFAATAGAQFYLRKQVEYDDTELARIRKNPRELVKFLT